METELNFLNALENHDKAVMAGERHGAQDRKKGLTALCPRDKPQYYKHGYRDGFCNTKQKQF